MAIHFVRQGVSAAEEFGYLPLTFFNIANDGSLIPLLRVEDFGRAITETQAATATLILIKMNMVIVIYNGIPRTMSYTMATLHTMMHQIQTSLLIEFNKRTFSEYQMLSPQERMT
jgi:hypothetical protein